MFRTLATTCLCTCVKRVQWHTLLLFLVLFQILYPGNLSQENLFCICSWKKTQNGNRLHYWKTMKSPMEGRLVTWPSASLIIECPQKQTRMFRNNFVKHPENHHCNCSACKFCLFVLTLVWIEHSKLFSFPSKLLLPKSSPTVGSRYSYLPLTLRFSFQISLES